MSLAAKLPWTHRYAKGFPGIGSQTMPTDADAVDYLTRMAAADGAGVEVSVAVAVDEFFANAKELGVFSALKACCILAGARTLEGAVVPVVGTAPTGVNFASGDYSRTAGLKGDGTSYLDSGRANDADPQNDNHVAAYVTAGYVAINNGALIGAQNAASAYTMTGTVSYNRGSIGNSAIQITSAGLYASSRKTQASFLYIRPPDDAQSLVSNSAIASGFSNNVFVYGYSNSSGSLVSPTDATVAFYSAGTGMDSDGLAALDTAVSNLITAIGEAL